MKFLFSLLLISLFVFTNISHPFYIGIVDSEHNPTNRTLEVAVKLFTNDLEDVLEADFNQNLHLNSAKEDFELVDSLLNLYLKEHLAFSINEKYLEYTIIGYEYELDAIWIYIEYSGTPLEFDKIDVYNDILIDYFPKQINKMRFKALGKVKFKNFSINSTRSSFTF